MPSSGLGKCSPVTLNLFQNPWQSHGPGLAYVTPFMTSLFLLLQPCSKPISEIPPVLFAPEPDNFFQTSCGALSYRAVLDCPIHFFLSIFMQLFVTLFGEISTEIPSSRATLGHKVCKTKCDLLRCNFVCEFYTPAFCFFSCSSVEQYLTCLH